jgi:hypothetical protein
MQYGFNKKVFSVPNVPSKIDSFEMIRTIIFNLSKMLTTLTQSIIQIQVVGSNPPALKTSIGVSGQLETDGDYLYLCVGTGNWIRFTKDATY